jgi:adenine-specific DNA methylase
MPLTLEQYQQIKIETEETIRKLISKELDVFHKQTGVLVKDIELNVLQLDVTTVDEIQQSDVLAITDVLIRTE